MIALFVLVVFSHSGSNGSVVSFQEFYSLKHCQYVAEAVRKDSAVKGAWCVNK